MFGQDPLLPVVLGGVFGSLLAIGLEEELADAAQQDDGAPQGLGSAGPTSVDYRSLSADERRALKLRQDEATPLSAENGNYSI